MSSLLGTQFSSLQDHDESGIRSLGRTGVFPSPLHISLASIILHAGVDQDVKNGPGTIPIEQSLWCHKPELQGPVNSVAPSMDTGSSFAPSHKMVAVQEETTGEQTPISTKGLELEV